MLKQVLTMVTMLSLVAGLSFAQLTWTKHLDPVLTGGPAGSWNKHVFMPRVLYNEDSSRYEMWFAASYGPPDWAPYRIGSAVSGDGITWTMHPDPVLSPTPGTWDSNTVTGPVVIRENGEYKMWYTAGGGKIGYATSPDGMSWTKHAGNPIFEAGADAWEAGGVYTGTVTSVIGGYKMWYSGWTTSFTHESVGCATSADGILWQRDTVNNPILEPGDPGDWDDYGVYLPQILVIDNMHYIWYVGNEGSLEQTGFASSPDGNSCSKHAGPVLSPSPGRWDDYWVESGTVILVGDTLHMWYAGSGGFGLSYLWQIGLATSPFISVSVGDQVFLPDEFRIEQNYPNPFNPSTTIEYALPQKAYVKLEVFNLLGEKVGVLADGLQEAATYSVVFDAVGLPSGVYFYRMQAGTLTQTRRMMLVR